MKPEEITPDVACLEFTIANAYFAGAPGASWVLIDTGVPLDARAIREAAQRRYGPQSRPAAILLTHGHLDHAGSAGELAAQWDVPVFAHRAESPFLTGQSVYPPHNPAVGGAMAFLSRFVPNTTVNIAGRLRELPAGEVPGLAGWTWHHTPGHTPGHVVFFHQERSLLIAGDAVVTMDLDSFTGLLTRARRISRPPAPFTSDWRQARESVQFLATLNPTHLAAGHGHPMSGEIVKQQLALLAKNFPMPRNT